MLSAELVQVLRVGRAAGGRVGVVVLLEMVGLGQRRGAAAAAGHRAGGMTQQQVRAHLGGGSVALCRGGQEATGGRIRQDPVPGALAPGQLAGHPGRHRDGGVEHTGSIRLPEERHRRDRDVDPDLGCGNRGAARGEYGAHQHVVAGAGEGGDEAARLALASRIDRQRGALLEGAALTVADGTGGEVQPS